MLTLTSGVETIFHLKFTPNTGANGVSLGNPNVTTSTLIRLKDKAGADRHELALKAMSEGNSSITIRDESGAVAAHFEISVVK